jgi:hypothetical protein
MSRRYRDENLPQRVALREAEKKARQQVGKIKKERTGRPSEANLAPIPVRKNGRLASPGNKPWRSAFFVSQGQKATQSVVGLPTIIFPPGGTVVPASAKENELLLVIS